MQHTISYTVQSKRYSSLIPNLTGSFFTIDIVCPSTVTSSSVIRPISGTYTYDIAQKSMYSISAPNVTLSPTVCFNIEDFLIIDQFNTAASFVTSSMASSSIEVQTTDRALVGMHSLTVKTLV